MPQFPFILGFQKSFEAFIRDEVAGSLLLHGFRVEVGDAFFQSAGGLRQIFDLPGAFGASAQGRGNELRRHEAHDRHEDDGDDDIDEGEAARVHWTNPVSAKRVSVIPPPKLNV